MKIVAAIIRFKVFTAFMFYECNGSSIVLIAFNSPRINVEILSQYIN